MSSFISLFSMIWYDLEKYRHLTLRGCCLVTRVCLRLKRLEKRRPRCHWVNYGPQSMLTISDTYWPAAPNYKNERKTRPIIHHFLQMLWREKKRPQKQAGNMKKDNEDGLVFPLFWALPLGPHYWRWLFGSIHVAEVCYYIAGLCNSRSIVAGLLQVTSP